MPILLTKRHIGGAAVAPPAPVNAGELMFNEPGFTGGGLNSLWIDTGTAVIPLVDSTRQVEIAGAQTITGAKTFSLASFLLGGGTAGQVLSTTGAGGVLAWVAPATGGSTYTFDIGLTDTAGSVNLDPALAAVIGGVSIPAGSALTISAAGALGLGIADAAIIETGTDAILPIAALGLRSQTGLPVAQLTTAAKTIVPAINELKAALAAGGSGVIVDGISIVGDGLSAGTALAVGLVDGGVF